MRGADSYNENLFTTVRLEEFVPASHPLRPIRTWVNDALAGMSAKLSAMYEADIKGGRPSIAPEKLLRAMLLQVLYSVRSERQLVEQISYNLLFRWFVGLSIDDPVWNGARQDGCRLIHAANCVLSTASPAPVSTAFSRSGFKVTTSTRDQFRVWRAQRRGLSARALR